MTLAEAGIVSIDLTTNLSNIVLPDGSRITGETIFTRADSSTGLVGNALLSFDPEGYAVEQTVTVDGSGNRTVVSQLYDAGGALAKIIQSVVSADGSSITISVDNNADGVFDEIQTLVTTIAGNGDKTETETNSTGGGYTDQSEIRTTHQDDHRTIVITDLNADRSVIRSATTTLSDDGVVRFSEIVGKVGISNEIAPWDCGWCLPVCDGRRSARLRDAREKS